LNTQSSKATADGNTEHKKSPLPSRMRFRMALVDDGEELIVAPESRIEPGKLHT